MRKWTDERTVEKINQRELERENISRQIRRRVREEGLIYSHLMSDWVNPTFACRKFKLFFSFLCFFPQFILTISSDKHLGSVQPQQRRLKLNADIESD